MDADGDRGQGAGFCFPAITGALTADTSPSVALPAILAAGAVEGSLLGLAQGVVLRRVLAHFPVRRWALATASAAMAAYAIGMLPSTVTAAPPWLLIVAAPVLGAALLASIGTAQWLILRTIMDRSASWIVTTALAWLAGLAVFLGFATPLWHPGQPLALTVAIGVTGGLLMAAVTSAVTGVAIRRRLNDRINVSGAG
ncbi:hypothetical protein JIG36_12520 [Actinoplanes sp. LDG1-06]|uniref:Uncharacterized protein n=1 Tax=Paractinoplanes ovalisporus TaxID=2810368 RepID=A0ABS2A974_9ACTN|nr:hypothetical protein [Actinoplanes ovalisporus]MBM2616382.1 hypothetical protein [Actinoplanes ovalisporus]